jgi:exopolysaccharide biosynthesis predicted pyruvyltransferase EpsI
MKKVLLVNRGRCSNIGDQAINQVFRRFLEKSFSVRVIESDYTYAHA